MGIEFKVRVFKGKHRKSSKRSGVLQKRSQPLDSDPYTILKMSVREISYISSNSPSTAKPSESAEMNVSLQVSISIFIFFFKMLPL